MITQGEDERGGEREGGRERGGERGGEREGELGLTYLSVVSSPVLIPAKRVRRGTTESKIKETRLTNEDRLW